VPGTHRYRLTDSGLHHASLLNHLHTRVLQPASPSSTAPTHPASSRLRSAARNYKQALAHLTREVDSPHNQRGLDFHGFRRRSRASAAASNVGAVIGLDSGFWGWGAVAGGGGDGTARRGVPPGADSGGGRSADPITYPTLPDAALASTRRACEGTLRCIRWPGAALESRWMDTAPGTGEFDLRAHRALTLWGRAANEWAVANGYGHGGYRVLLDAEVVYVTSARGRVQPPAGATRRRGSGDLMPRAARVCSVPGCPVLCAGGRCAGHRREADRARGTFRERGYRGGHDRFRAAILAREPRCRLCLNPATVADHWPHSRRELVAMGADPDDPRAGRALCAPCHGRETQATPDQRGGWNRR
jgi:5-methylcytosine-specific restriction protein A